MTLRHAQTALLCTIAALLLAISSTCVSALRADVLDRDFLRAHFQAHLLQRDWLPTRSSPSSSSSSSSSSSLPHDLADAGHYVDGAITSGGDGALAFEDVDAAAATAASSSTVAAALGPAVASNKKVLFVTAIYGDYEKTLKEPVEQTHPADFVAFTNRPDLTSQTWQIRLVGDPLDYLIKHGGNVGVGSTAVASGAEGGEMTDVGDVVRGITTPQHPSADGINSLANNKHPFNQAKVFKMQFYRFFDLQQYRAAVWLDATLHIIGPETAGVVFKMIDTEHRNLITFEHNRQGSLSAEAIASKTEKYEGTHWGCCDQPFQNVTRQYEEYLAEGFREKWWLQEYDAPLGISKRPEWGLWVTSFVAFDLHSPTSFEFLDAWWRENVVHSTQDQVSFPYLAWKMKVYPFSLPSPGFSGGSWMYNDFFARLEHGNRKSV